MDEKFIIRCANCGEGKVKIFGFFPNSYNLKCKCLNCGSLSADRPVKEAEVWRR